MLEQRPDEVLVEVYLGGEQASFTALIERYHLKLIAFAYHILQQREDSEDAVQETWLKVWQNIRTYETTRKFSSWLYKTCQNECYMALRKRHHKFNTLPEDLDSIKSKSIREFAFDKVAREWCLAVLNHRQHLLYDAIMVRGMSYEAVLQDVKELCPAPKGRPLEAKPEDIEKLRTEFCEIMEIIFERAKERIRRDIIDKEKNK
jgi:RNA polymerase sigma-70 factor (ECF subfamily)